MDRYPKRNKKILPEHAKMKLGKEKLSWRSNWQDASVLMLVASESTRET